MLIPQELQLSRFDWNVRMKGKEEMIGSGRVIQSAPT